MQATFTAFAGSRRLVTGARVDVALALWRAREDGAEGPLLAFDDATGGEIDFDLRGCEDEIVERHADPPAEPQRARGRPKLGVVAREVTLLPRHWEWLAAQPGGASAALRRMIDEARRADAGATGARQGKAAAFRFLNAMAGDRPGFEAAIRALFADDRDGFSEHARDWPPDIADHAIGLAFGDADLPA